MSAWVTRIISAVGLLVIAWIPLGAPLLAPPVIGAVVLGGVLGYKNAHRLPADIVLATAATLILVLLPPMMLTFLGYGPQMLVALGVFSLGIILLGMAIGVNVRKSRLQGAAQKR